MLVLEWKWKRLAFRRSRLVDDCLTKSIHIILVRVDYNAMQLVKVYPNEIVRLHEVPLSIIPNFGIYVVHI